VDFGQFGAAVTVGFGHGVLQKVNCGKSRETVFYTMV
jgi:hypothetical protein